MQLYKNVITQSAGVVEYTDCFSAEGYDSPTSVLWPKSAGAAEYTDCISVEGNDSPIGVLWSKSAGAAEFTDCFSAEGYDSPTSVLWPTLAGAAEYPDCISVTTQRMSWYDTEQSDGEAPVMHGTPTLPSLPGPLCPGGVAPYRVLSLGEIELNCVLILNWIVWSRTVYMYTNEFRVNNLQ